MNQGTTLQVALQISPVVSNLELSHQPLATVSRTRPENRESAAQIFDKVRHSTISWLPVAIVLGLIIYGSYVFIIMLCFNELLISGSGRETRGILYLIFYLYFTVLFFINYGLAIFMNPGSALDYRKVQVSSSNLNLSIRSKEADQFTASGPQNVTSNNARIKEMTTNQSKTIGAENNQKIRKDTNNGDQRTDESIRSSGTTSAEEDLSADLSSIPTIHPREPPINETSNGYEYVMIDECKKTVIRVPMQRFCGICGVGKPSRCHHCSTCSRCILKMDHHCPWINNCVGYRNYKFFILSVFYAIGICGMAFGGLLQYLCTLDSGSSFKAVYVNFIVICVFAVIFGVLCVVLLSYHLFLMSHNRTTIEQLDLSSLVDRLMHTRQTTYGRPLTFDEATCKADIYNIGVWKNVCQALGSNPLIWILPVPVDVCKRGYVYPRRNLHVPAASCPVETA